MEIFTSTETEGTCKDSNVQYGRYPSKLGLIKYELIITVYNFKYWIFQLWFLYKSDLCISTADLNTFKPRITTISSTL